MKTYLDVPFEERAEAKALGAKWDLARKRWYVEDHQSLEKFMRWMPGIDRKVAAKWSKKVAQMNKRQATRGRFR